MSKSCKKNVKFINQNVGPEKRQDYLDDIDYKGSYLPKSVGYEDIDRTFIEFVDKDIEALQNKVAQKLGYKLVDHKLELYGSKIKK